LLALAVPATIGIEPATATAEGSTTAVIAGEVVGSDGSPAVGVGVYLSNSQGSAGYATTDNGGSYRLDGLAADSYTLLFWCREACVGNYVEEYWENAPSASSATPLVLADGEQVRLKTELTTAGAVSGTVRGADGTVLKGIGAILTQRDTGVSWSKFVATDAAGNYQFRNVPPAGYTVEFRPAVGTGEHLGEYWNDATTLSGSDVLLVAAGETTTGVDSVLAPAAWITGRLVNEEGVPFSSADDVDVMLSELRNGDPYWVNSVEPGSYKERGGFRFDGLRPGSYILHSSAFGWGGLYGVKQFWEDKTDWRSADPIVVSEGDRRDFTFVLRGGPVSLTGPKVSGTARVGETLTATASSPTVGATLSYQWSAGGVPIEGATGTTFVPTAGELAKQIGVKVVAAAPGRVTLTRSSELTSAVALGVLTAPTPTTAGDAVVGTTLTVTTGEWSGGAALSYQWLRSGTPVSSEPDYTLTSADAGRYLRVDVTGTKPGYGTVTRSSAPVGPVVHGTVDLEPPTVTGIPEIGSTLSAVASSSTPGATFHYEWYADGTPITSGSWPDLTLAEAHLGARISLKVTAFATDYRSASLTSGQVGPVVWPAWGEVSRLSGADRYATSVAVSRSEFAPGVDTVFIASGAAFPDALSGAGVAALRNGPLLLTPSAGLPQVVIDEITRLKPKTAIIFGGTGAVSSKVQSQLSQLTGGVYVPRFSGPDRYTTSAAISQMEFSPLAPPVVYIANGANFPDALSGAPLAGQERGPLLLSTATSIPSSIAAELDRLNPQRIVILGGTGSISDAVARQLGTYTSGGVTRLAGPDRYQTSAAISKASFDAGVPVAYIANGANFPDALSGAPVAGIQGGPVLLTPASALPQAVVDELQRLRPERIVILGGTGSVGSVVQQQLDALG
jgi:putative cell wall-binding protein